MNVKQPHINSFKRYLEKEEMIDKMISLTKLSQKELAFKIGVSEATLSKNKKEGVSEKTRKKFFKAFPHIQEIELCKVPDEDIISLELSKDFLLEMLEKFDDDPNVFSGELTHASAILGIRYYIRELFNKKDELIEKLLNREYKPSELSGGLKELYLANTIPNSSIKKLEILPLGFCIGGSIKNCSDCLNSEKFITTIEFVPVFKLLKLNMVFLENILKYKGTMLIPEVKITRELINKTLKDFNS